MDKINLDKIKIKINNSYRFKHLELNELKQIKANYKLCTIAAHRYSSYNKENKKIIVIKEKNGMVTIKRIK